VQIDESLKCHDNLNKIKSEIENGDSFGEDHDSEGSEDFHEG
jgi:hypothetical protein